MRLVLFLIAIILLSCNQGERIKTNLPKPKDYDDYISYLVGYDVGRSMHRDSIKVNIDYFVLGLKNGIKEDTSFIPQRELDSVRMQFQASLIEKQDKRRKEEERKLREQAPINLEKGKEFLAKNKQQPGVVETPSGLQYMIQKEGTGRVPKLEDWVKIHVRGMYIDGKEFDNTYQREPVVLPVYQQVQGWREALTMMKEGSKWRIFVPPHLGWGERGAPPTIPPNATLIFELELLSIEQPPQPNK